MDRQGSDRRTVGLLVILFVLLAAVVLPNVAARKLPGSAEIGPVPVPPAVGDCLLQPTSVQGWRIVNQRPVYAQVEMGPCSGARFGEVAAVISSGLSAGIVRSTDPGGEVVIVDPNENLCAAAVSTYVGSTPPAGSNLANQWTLAFGVGSGAAAPTDLQVRFGQKWIACLTFAAPGSAADDGVLTAAYAGTLRGGFVAGALPPVLARCLATADSIRASSCTESHAAELFASISTNPAGTTAASLATNCRTLVRKYTRMPDPTVGGRLVVQIRATHVIREKVFQGLGPPGDSTGFATCVVTTTSAAEHLMGPLLGLGTGAVPLA